VTKLEGEMLKRFQETHPADVAEPPKDLSGPDLLDWYLVPRDKKERNK
jgi:hypothetical protein